MTTTRHTIRLSHLTTVDAGTRSARRVPELAVDHPAASWSILPGVEVEANGRHALGVQSSETGDVDAARLAADWRYPAVPCWPCAIAEYRQAMRACLERVCDAVTVTFTAAGLKWSCPAAKAYRDYATAVALRVLAGDTSEGSVVQLATTGVLYSLPRLLVPAWYLAYVHSLTDVAGVDLIGLSARIETAESAADLDALRIPRHTIGA